MRLDTLSLSRPFLIGIGSVVLASSCPEAFAVDQDLLGVGFWALNYEEGDPAFWAMVQDATVRDDEEEPAPASTRKQARKGAASDAVVREVERGVYLKANIGGTFLFGKLTIDGVELRRHRGVKTR